MAEADEDASVTNRRRNNKVSEAFRSMLDQYHIGDARSIDNLLPCEESIDVTITSPPYWGLRDYGEETVTIWDDSGNCEHIFQNQRRKHPMHRDGATGNLGNKKGLNKAQGIISNDFCSKCNAWKGQLGLEPTIELYLTHLLQITSELKRILKKTGVMYWNHGDNYGGSGKGHGSKTRGKNLIYEECHPKKTGGIDKCLCLQNYRLIQKMIDEQSWILRNIII